MTSSAGAETRKAEWFQQGLEGILSNYVRARSQERLEAGHPLWRHAKQLGRELENSAIVHDRADINVRWSFGQGAWARIPWLDRRVAKATSAGVYVIYLFREDMSGVYATLNQGITQEKDSLGADAARISIRQRSEKLREFARDLDKAGFLLGNDLDLRTEHGLGKDYKHGTVAYRLYESGKVPTTSALLEDLRLLLEAYDAIVQSVLARRA
jgi:5-methylcytosine-specific restriction protein A